MENELMPSIPLLQGLTTIGGFEYEVVKQVTRTVLRQIDYQPLHVQFVSPIRQSTIETPTGRGPAKNAADIADIVNLETGELMLLIINTVLKKTLERDYPDHSYVGRYFGIVRTDPNVDRSGDDVKKAYKTYKIIEFKPKKSIDNEAVID